MGQRIHCRRCGAVLQVNGSCGECKPLPIDNDALQAAASVRPPAESTRAKFEEAVFGQFYVKSIVRNPDPAPRIAGCLDFVPGNSITKAEFCEMQDGHYVREELNAMWFGWCLHYDRG